MKRYSVEDFKVPEFAARYEELYATLEALVLKYRGLSSENISLPRNSQRRNIKQILGHMIDSASNNIHRIVHLQYRESPVEFPNYATYGNNDRWISIQNYQEEDWNEMIDLWKSLHLHIIHVVKNISHEKLQSLWLADKNSTVSLKAMVQDFPRHFWLHVEEIDELIES